MSSRAYSCRAFFLFVLASMVPGAGQTYAVVPTRTVALSGQAAPGAPGVVISFFATAPVIDNAGRTAFFAILTGPAVTAGVNDESIWSEGSSVLTLVARSGSPAPGAPGVNFRTFSEAIIISAGRTAFRAFLIADVGDEGIWSEGSGALALVVRGGSPAPGTPAGVNFSNPEDPVFNSAGQIAFLTDLNGTGVDPSNNESIWSEGSGVLALVARAGDPAPGTPAGVNFIS